MRMSLSTKQKTRLRSLCHSLKPVIIVGGAGVSAPLLAELHQALAFHELVKIRLPAGDRVARQRMIEQLCAETGAELIQAIGRMATLYRRGDTPRIVLPE